jgi:hypothetical protein
VKVNLPDVSYLSDNSKIQDATDEIAINPMTETKKSSMLKLLTAFALIAFFFSVVIGITSNEALWYLLRCDSKDLKIDSISISWRQFREF